MTLRKDAYDATVEVAKAEGIDPAKLLAVVEVESSGRPYEAADTDASDGLAPTMMFERHVFLRELRKRAPAKVAAAKKAGLTAETWNKKTAYVDQRTSAGRLDVLRRAMEIDRDCAIRATSLGLFQVMGHHAESLGYADAETMYDSVSRGLVKEQIRIGVAFMRKNGLVAKLERKDWAGFALGYNGRAYKKNAYDQKLASAYAKYETVIRAGAKLATETPAKDLTLRLGSKGARVRALQTELSRVGYATAVDGDYGPTTRRQVGAFQLDHELQPTGEADPETISRLEAAEPIALGAREVFTASDMKKDPVVKNAGVVEKAGLAVTATGVVATLSYNSDAITENVDRISTAADKLQAAGGIATKALAWVMANPSLVITVIAGVVIFLAARSAIQAFVEKKHAGEAL